MKCVGWAASPWWSKTGVYEDRLEEGETAATMPSRQVVAAIGQEASLLQRNLVRGATTAREKSWRLTDPLQLSRPLSRAPCVLCRSSVCRL